MKKDAFYFPHFSNARTDSKILKLRRVLGIEGYGIYFMLLEVLREQTDYKLPLNSVEDLEFEFRVSKEKINTVISNYDLFEIVDDKFFSPKLVYFLQPYLEKTTRARNAAEIRWKNANASANASANAMQVKESKVNKVNKVKEIKEVIPSVDEFIDYCKPFLDIKEFEFSLKAKYEAWVQNGWKDGNGDKIKNWKIKIKNTIPYLKPFKAVEIPKIGTYQKTIKDRFISPVLREAITIDEWVQEFHKIQPDLNKLDLTFINQSCIPNSEKWMKAVMQQWYSKF